MNLILSKVQEHQSSLRSNNSSMDTTSTSTGKNIIYPWNWNELRDCVFYMFKCINLRWYGSDLNPNTMHFTWKRKKRKATEKPVKFSLVIGFTINWTAHRSKFIRLRRIFFVVFIYFLRISISIQLDVWQVVLYYRNLHVI